MKAILIDDERHALLRLNRLLDDIDKVEVIGVFENPSEALEFMKSTKPDVVFLDIEMPMNGLEVFGRIMDLYGYLSIIFTTAYNQYAIKAFELNAIDYLLKPFKLERLKKAIDRVEKYNSSFNNLQESSNKNQYKDIYVQCFKRLSMYYNGKIINLNWRTKKADELIAYLVCEKGEYVSKDKIIDSLWPDLDSKKGLNNLYTTLYYIRKQEQKLSINIPIESIRGKMKLDVSNINVDILEYEDIYNQYKKGGLINKDKLINLYKGMLFEEHDYPWAVINQSRYECWYEEITNSI